MPGTNLTRAEAAERARLLTVSTYDVVARPDHLGRDVRVDDDDPFRCIRAGGDHVRRPRRRRLSTRSLSTANDVDLTSYRDSRITLHDLQAENVLTVVTDLPLQPQR